MRIQRFQTFFLSCVVTVAMSVTTLPAVCRAGNSNQSVSKIYFTRMASGAGVPGTKAAKVFDCSDKIYIVIEAVHLKPGDRHIEVLWYRPDGRRQEDTNFTVRPKSGVKDRFWAWLALHRPADGVVVRVLLQDRSFGMEDFVGRWTAKVYINGNLLGKETFKLYC